MTELKIEVHNPKDHMEIKDIKLYPKNPKDDSLFINRPYWLDFKLLSKQYDLRSKSIKFTFRINGIHNHKFEYVESQYFEDFVDLLGTIHNVELTVPNLQDAYKDGMKLHIMSKPVMKAIFDNINITMLTNIVEEN